ncbi:MAG: alpha/beta fold hydrolase [Clostridium sp.]
MNKSLYIKSKDVDLFTTIRGNDESNKIIIILHGGPGSGAEPLLNHDSFKELEERFILVYFDQRGSGKSTYDLENKIREEDITYDVHVIVNYIKENYKGKKVYLWGGSFGGALGFLYLRNYPNEVEKYVGACPAVFFSEEGVKNTVKRLLNSYKNRIPKSFIFLANTIPLNSKGIKGILNRKQIKEFIFSSNSKSLKHSWAMSDWLFDQRFGEDFKKIKIPVLITHGKNDELIDYNNVYEGYSKFKNPLISFMEYENCGHTIFEDKKECFAKDIEKFFM